MGVTTEILNKLNNHIKSALEENRLAHVVDEEVAENIEEVELIKIKVDTVDSNCGTEEYLIYTNTFRLGTEEVDIDVFSARDAIEEEVFLNSHYSIEYYSRGDQTIERAEESELHIHREAFGIVKVLNSIDYHFIFNKEATLLRDLHFELDKKQSEKLLVEAQPLFPGLAKVRVAGIGRACMIFEKGYELNLEVHEIERAIQMAENFQKQKLNSN